MMENQVMAQSIKVVCCITITVYTGTGEMLYWCLFFSNTGQVVSPSRCRRTSSISIVAIEAAPESLSPIGRGRGGAEDAGSLALLMYHALCWSSRHDVVASGGRWNMGSSGSIA